MKNKNYNILMTIPHTKGGGIVSFCNALTPFFPNVDFIKRGVKDGVKSRIKIIIDLLEDYVNFIKILFKKKYDIIFVNASLSKIGCIRDGIQIFIAKVLRKKVLLYIHGFEEEQLEKKWLCKGFLLADVIVVLAEEFREKIKKYGFKRQIYVSFNPVDKNIVDAVSKSDIEKRINKRITNILFIARIEMDKGIIITLKIFKLLKRKYSWLKLYVAGIGSALNEAKDFVKNNSIDDVYFLGLVAGKEKINLFVNSDILLFPTFHKEGLPINVLESMVVGMPVITRAIGGIKDFFQDNEIGYLVESLEPEDFIIKIENLMNSQNYARISNNSYYFGQTHFHPKIVASNLEKIIDLVVNH